MQLKKFLSIIVLFSLLFTSRSFFFKNEVFAQEAGAEIDEVDVVCQKLARDNQNELEIPIGKAVDQAEYLADQVIAQAQVIIATAQQQIDAANGLSGLANQCGNQYCRPVCEAEEVCGSCNCTGCDNASETSCALGFCTGEIAPTLTCCCPSATGCSTTGCRITGACNEGERRNPSACASQCQTCHQSHCCCTVTFVCTARSCENSAGDRACALGIPAAVSNINTLYTTIIITHDQLRYYYGYYDSDVLPFLAEANFKLENCKPPTNDSDFEAVMKGEKSGKWLFTCTQILNMTELGVPIHSYLPFWNGSEVEFPDEPERGCYGNDYCKHLESIEENLPYGQPSCAEDFYCCIIGK